MVFSSPIFLFCFLPLLCGCYAALSRTSLASKNSLLLFASLLFYAWGEPLLLPLMLLTVLLCHMLGQSIACAKAESSKKIRLKLGLVLIFSGLFIFKYLEFFVRSASTLAMYLGFEALDAPSILLPLGISFYTFQAASYLIDVYRGDASAQRSLTNTALYIALFPQLIAGPIVRYSEIADQLSSRSSKLEDVFLGVQRFLIGLAKKVLIANTLAEFVDFAFGLGAPAHSMTIAWLVLLCYALQIYYDFSGYSDMAIGLGRIFGFRIPENFNLPYCACSVTEFWRRWHMTLSRWFRDYLYIPLGGNRQGSLKTYRNLFLVFFLCGLWHGAAWTFVAWGVLHGLLLVIERLGFSRVLEKAPAPLCWAYTFFFVLLAWLPFRAESFGQTAEFLAVLFGAGAEPDPRLLLALSPELLTALLFGLLFALPSAKLVQSLLLRIPVFLQDWLLRPAAYISLLTVVGMKLASGTYNPFIYFRF